MVQQKWGIMKYIKEKVEAGVLDLTEIPTTTLIQWSLTALREDRDVLGCEIVYREW